MSSDTLGERTRVARVKPLLQPHVAPPYACLVGVGISSFQSTQFPNARFDPILLHDVRKDSRVEKARNEIEILFVGENFPLSESLWLSRRSTVGLICDAGCHLANCAIPEDSSFASALEETIKPAEREVRYQSKPKPKLK